MSMAMGPMRAAPGPVRKSKNARVTTRRLLMRLAPERLRLLLALGLGVMSVGFVVSGPQILGSATNVLFDGIVSKRLPLGTTKAQAISQLNLRFNLNRATRQVFPQAVVGWP